MSYGKKMEMPSSDDDSSEVGIHDDSGKVYNPVRTVNEKLPSVGDLESENQPLPSPKSVAKFSQRSNLPSTSFSHALNMDQLGENTDTRHVFSGSDDALISPRQLSTSASVPIPDSLDVVGARNNQSNLSLLEANLVPDFSSPPDRDTVTLIRSRPKNLKETNTPSPDKRSAEVDEGSTPIKKLRKTSGRNSGKAETELCSSKASPLAAGNCSYESPTNLLQHLEAPLQDAEGLESLNVPIASGKRKRNKARNNSGESKAADAPCLSNLTSYLSDSKTISKSPISLQMHKSEIAARNNESPSERKTLTSVRDCSADSNAIASDDNLLQKENSLALSMKELGFTASDELKDTSSSNPNIGTRKQRDMLAVADISDEGTLIATQRHGETILHLTALTDTSSRQIDDTENKKDELPVSVASFEAVRTDLSIEETKSAPNLRLTDKTPSSSKSQSPKTLDFESYLKFKRMWDSIPPTETNPSSSDANSANETQILKSSQLARLVLNPLLTSSCHLPQQNISPFTDAPRRKSKFCETLKRLAFDQNQSDSSSCLGADESEELPEIHQTTLSDKTLVPENSPKPSQSKSFQEMSPRSHSTQSPPCRLRMHRRSVSDETPTSRHLIEDQAQQDGHNSPIGSRSIKTSSSKSLSEISKSTGRTTCVVPPLFIKRSVPGASNTSSTSRNNPEIQSPQERHPSGEASTSRNQPEVVSNLYPPHIGVSEGQASTSRYQPIVEGRFSFEHSYQPTQSGGPEIRGNEVSLLAFEEASSPVVRQQSSSTDDSSSYSSNHDSSERQYDRMLRLIAAPGADKHPEYLADAREILFQVLKEIMFHNGEEIEWNTLTASFGRIFDPSSLLYTVDLVVDLTQYLSNKACDLSDTVMLSPHQMTEMCIQILYGKLTVMVVKALILILSVQTKKNYTALIIAHRQFRSLCDFISSSQNTTFVQDIQDEASRNRMKAMNELVKRLSLVVLIAFRFLLIYVGENASDAELETFLSSLSEEDQIYLLRNIGQRF